MSEIVVPTTTEIKAYLFSRLRESGWYDKFRLYLNGESFEKVLQTLLNDYGLGYRIVPSLKLLFRAFECCPYEKMNVLIYTNELSPHLGKYNGIAFSQSITGRANNPLINMFAELKETNPKYAGSPNLERWAQQGILMVPSALSTLVDQKDAHIELWKPLFNQLFDIIKHDKPDCICAFVGEEVWGRADDLKNHITLKYVHPQKNFPEPYNSGMFSDINNALEAKGKTKITW